MIIRKRGFNIIGFNTFASSPYRPKHSCVYCHCTMVPKKKDDGTWDEGIYCPLCGMKYTEKEAVKQDEVKSRLGHTKPMIISGRSRKKKYYAKDGNEIKDPDLFNKTVISYREVKSGEDKVRLVGK